MRPIYCVLFLLWLGVVYPTFSQLNRDSLERVFEESDSDSIKTTALRSLFYQSHYSYPKQALSYANQLFEFAQDHHYQTGLWEAHNMFGVYFYQKGSYDSSLYWFGRAFAISEDDKFAEQRAYTLDMLGLVYKITGDYRKAQERFKDLILLGKKMKWSVYEAKGYLALGTILFEEGFYPKALENFLKADSVLDKGDRTYVRGEILDNIGIVYTQLGKTSSAEKYYKQAARFYKTWGYERGLHTLEVSLGNMELAKGNIDRAEDYLQRAQRFFDSEGDRLIQGEINQLLGQVYLRKKGYAKAEGFLKKSIQQLKDTEMNLRSRAYIDLAKVYSALKNYSKAFIVLDSAYNISFKSGHLATMIEVKKLLADLYNETGDSDKGFIALSDSHQLMDSLNAIQLAKAIYETEVKYQDERKEQAIQLPRTENVLRENKQKAQFQIFVILISASLLIVLILFYLFRTKHQANKKLLEMDNLKSSFFANISQEFRTPLTLITGPAEQQLRKSTLSEDDRKAFETIAQQSERLLGLVDQLLDLSRIESGSLRLRVSNGNINTFLNAAAESFQYLAIEKQIDYKVEIDSRLNEAWFDKDVVYKILVNLLSNALKYSDYGGKVSLHATLVDDNLHLEVENTGIGISRENLPRIFEKFYQVNSRKTGGAGIGLALVKELVFLSRGKIDVISQPEGSTVFQVQFPIVKEAFSKRELEDNSVNVHRQTALSEAFFEGELDEGVNTECLALVVEDRPDVRKFIGDILRDEYALLFATTGKEGIDLAIERVPDIILSDVTMPEVDGVVLCNTLKEDTRTCHIPIVLLTAKAGAENELDGLNSGADDYITKPFSDVLLKTRLAKLLKIRKVLHERYRSELSLKPMNIPLTSSEERFIAKVTDVLNVHLSDSTFSLETFCSEVGMSRMQLHRKIKALTGMSAMAFLRSQRLKVASDLLKTYDGNISEVGYQVGFSDPAYFTKSFRETFGCTPTEFMRRNRKNLIH